MISKKQTYHLEPPQGLLNDPNGLVWFKDKFYCFFQWNRLAKDHSYKEWGLFTTEDFIDWNFMGTAMLPDQIYDFKGIYSGSGVVIEDNLYLFYTGNTNWAGHRRVHQSLAISEDGKSFVKTGPVLETPSNFTEHFRDPKVNKVGDHYEMILGAQKKDGTGAIALCKSKDGISFNYESIVGSSREYEMIECPDLITIDHQRVLLYCPQKRDNQTDTALFSFSCYKLLDSYQDEEVIDLDSYVLMDHGFDFYAPQSTMLPDKRRILFGWMSQMNEEETAIFSIDEPRVHCLTIPRQLSIKEGRLIQRPLEELYKLLGNDIPVINGQAKPTSRSWHLFIADKSPLDSFQIDINQKEAFIEYSKEEGLFKFTRKNWATHEFETKEVLIERLYILEIWSDTSSIEIFLNDGAYSLSNRIYPESSNLSIKISGLDDQIINSLKNIMKGEEIHDR